MKNIFATPHFRYSARRSARFNVRSSMVAQADAQLATLSRTIAEIKAVQAETAELQARGAQTLNAMRSPNVAKTS